MNIQKILLQLAEKLVWVAPVGNEEYDRLLVKTNKFVLVPTLRGFMVCKRSVNNPDGKNTRVDYLRVNESLPDYIRWKKPFRENECMFPTMEEAIIAAAKMERIPISE